MGSTPSLRERNRLRAREDILDAATEALGSELGAEFSLEQLSARAGLSRGTIYSHFPGGREEIIRAAYLREAEIVRDRGLELRAGADSVPERIVALARALVEIASTPSGRFYGRAGTSADGGLTLLLQGAMGGTSRYFEELIRQDLEEAAASGQLAESAAPSSVAVLFTGAMRAAGGAAAQDPSQAASLIAAMERVTSSVVGSQQRT